jgi:hypothetical protein
VQLLDCCVLGVIGLTEDMFEDGYTSITNIDISRVVIDQMIERCKEKPTLICTSVCSRSRLLLFCACVCVCVCVAHGFAVAVATQR